MKQEKEMSMPRVRVKISALGFGTDQRYSSMTRLPRRDFLALAGTTGALLAQPANARAIGESWVPPRSFLEKLPSLMRLGCLPGLAMAVVDQGDVIWTKNYGVANAERKSPVDGATLFEAASASKPVFAYAVMQLVDRKTIDLDRPLASYHKPSYMPDDPALLEITARHVLTHSSGLPNWGDEEKPESFKPAFRPGTGFTYSGEGFFWLQVVIERLTGLSLDKFMRTQLFEPAGMIHSSFSGDVEIGRAMASGHIAGRVARDTGFRGVLSLVEPLSKNWGKALRDWTQDDWVRAGHEIAPKTPPKRVRFANAAASMVTTATDYAKFLALLMHRTSPASWEISPAARRAMITPQIEVQRGEPLWWGLGWAVDLSPRFPLFSHEGNNEGRFVCYAGGDAEKGRGIVIMTNGDSGSGISQRIVRAATGIDPLSFIAAMNPPSV
jgi:CubicO group peptidase (beta-lactamase class C family)